MIGSRINAQDPKQVSRGDAIGAADAQHSTRELIATGQLVRRGTAQAQRSSRGCDIHDRRKREELSAGQPVVRRLAHVTPPLAERSSSGSPWARLRA